MPRTLPLLSLGLLSSLIAFGDPAADLPAFQVNELAEFHIPPVGTAAPGRFYNLFRPFRTEAATLSPDGKRLAYSIREGDSLYVITVDIANPAHPLARMLVGTAKTSTPTLAIHSEEKTPARIRWMSWVNPNRLLIETNANLWLGGHGNISGGIFAVNADGTNPRTLGTPLDFQRYTTHRAWAGGTFGAYGGPLQTGVFMMPTPDAYGSASEEALLGRDRNLASRDNDLPIDSPRVSSPSFFDYAPGQPEWIIVRAGGHNDYGLYRIHVDSGEFRYGPSESANGDIATLINRQGAIGVSIANSMRTSFPHTFKIPKTSVITLGRWRELSSLVKETAADFSVSPENFFGQRSFPLGFDENPDVLYYASNVGRDTYAVYGVNIKTGERAGRSIESPDVDLAIPSVSGFTDAPPLVFDRYTRELTGVRYQSIVRSAVWLRPDLQDVQTSMEKEFPGRSVDILEWDEARNRFLTLVRGPAEPGSFYIVDRTTRKAMEFVRRSDLPAESEPRFTRYFTLKNPAGGDLTGFIIIPNAVRQKPIPTIVMCADEPWQAATAEFDGEINALAQMGFAVLQINPRGTWGFGAKYRGDVGDAFDEAQTADIIAAVDGLATTLPIHPGRVAIMGRGRGGFLALRAAQLRPDRFRCVVGVNPTVDLSNWSDYTRWTSNSAAPTLTKSFFGKRLIESNPLMDNPGDLKRPTFILVHRGNDGSSPTQMYLDARTLARRVENVGTPVEFRTLSHDYMRRMPEARSDVMRHIEDFLNLNIYNYDVQMGDTKVTGL